MDPHEKAMETLKAKLSENIAEAVDVVGRYYPNAQHHEHWVVDQVMRFMLGEELYAEFIIAFESPKGEKGERWIDNWDAGIAP